MKRPYLLFVISGFVLSCSETTEQTSKNAPRPINPNGDSELALLMRDMFDESDSLKQLVLDGKQLSGLKKYQEIHSAIPTDPDASGPVFEAFASSYIESIKALEASDSAAVFNFNRMVDQCMNCHTEFCPGPKKRIKKLYIRES
jgi:hypothetical protein